MTQTSKTHQKQLNDFKPSRKSIFTGHSEAVLLLWIIFVIYVSCFFDCSLQPCGHLLGRGWPLGSLVCDVLLYFCHFPMRCPGSGVVLDF